MNAQEARKIANKNGYQEKLEKKINQIERDIQNACERGSTSTCFGYLDEYKDNIERDAKEHFKKLGYTFKPTGYIQGVYQVTESICW